MIATEIAIPSPRRGQKYEDGNGLVWKVLDVREGRVILQHKLLLVDKTEECRWSRVTS